MAESRWGSWSPKKNKIKPFLHRMELVWGSPKWWFARQMALFVNKNWSKDNPSLLTSYIFNFILCQQEWFCKANLVMFLINNLALCISSQLKLRNYCLHSVSFRCGHVIRACRQQQLSLKKINLFNQQKRQQQCLTAATDRLAGEITQI